jgi:serine/threonine protein kinase
MSLSAGTRLGPYEITGPLGAGGMGEVYRARDSRLNRDVAIKTLPAAFFDDANRMARLQREAQVLASLKTRFRTPLSRIHAATETRCPQMSSDVRKIG